jgi:hypothetical protein
MAAIIKEKINDMLYILDENALNYTSYFPPIKLKKKIIIKGKGKLLEALQELFPKKFEKNQANPEDKKKEKPAKSIKKK